MQRRSAFSLHRKRDWLLELMIFHFHFSRSEVPLPLLLGLICYREDAPERWLMRRDVSESRLMSIRLRRQHTFVGAHTNFEDGTISFVCLCRWNLHLPCRTWAYGSWQGVKSTDLCCCWLCVWQYSYWCWAGSGQSLHAKINDLSVAYVHEAGFRERQSSEANFITASSSLRDSKSFEL